MARVDEVLEQVRQRVPECDPGAAWPDHTRVIDVREADEVAAGQLANATWIPRGRLELQIDATVPDLTTPIVVYCAGGKRSLLAARALLELGYQDVRSLRGGFGAWKAAGLPWITPTLTSPEQLARYARHIALPQVGTAGQARLLASSVALIGAGGLGSPALLYLAAAGVGTLGVFDDDTVDASNLQRQVAHNLSRVGENKAESARQTVRGLNPDVTVVPHQVRLTAANALDLLAPYEIVVDGTDNFATRYVLNDACLRLGRPLVHASIYRFEGQLAVFGHAGGPCYRCLFPSPPPPELAPSCAEAGVFGVLPGVLGVLQATEVLKLLLGIGSPLADRVLTYDALDASFRELRLARDPHCPACGDAVDRTRPLADTAGPACSTSA